MTKRAATTRLTWRAGSNQIAHASESRGTRTLCGAPVIDERYAWPAERTCMVCSARIDALIAEAR